MNIQSLIDKIILSNIGYPAQTFLLADRINTFVNPYSYLILRRKPHLLKRMNGIFIDGISMCIWIKLFWGKKIARRSFDMTSVAKDLFNELNENGKSIYFIGSKKKEIEQAIEVINQSYPNLNISGFRDGYIKNSNEKNQFIEEVLKLRPDYLIIGMGTPKQEEFAIEVREKGYTGIIFTCGGFLHQTAQGINYYPDWVNKYNLRGFYRQYKEKGIIKRNYDTFILFPLIFLYDTLITKISKN